MKQQQILDFQNIKNEPLLYCNTATVAKLFSISTKTALKYAEQGILPKPMKLGNINRWDVVEITQAYNDFKTQKGEKKLC